MTTEAYCIPETLIVEVCGPGSLNERVWQKVTETGMNEAESIFNDGLI